MYVMHVYYFLGKNVDISQVFSNGWSVLSQCNTQLRLLHLLYDIDFTCTKQYNPLFLCFIL